MFSKMPFGLMNVGTTLERNMEIDFAEEKDMFVVIYMDEITIYS